jgi:hypothetical protein
VPVALTILEAGDLDAPGSDEIPDPRPPRFYVVRGIGGRYDNPAFSDPRVLVECWAEDSSTAEQMCLDGIQMFKNARGRIYDGVQVIRVYDVQGPTDYNDPDIQDRRRSQFFCTLSLSTN